jgi:hypothetical protein
MNELKNSFMTKVFSPIGRKQMKYLLGLLVALVITDGLLTHFLVDGRRAWEFNPFLEPLVGGAGFLILKTVGALLCAFILWDVYRHFPRMGVIATWAAVAAYGVIVLWNTSWLIIM